MDLGTLVKTDGLHRLELVHPISDKPLGVTFEIRSYESKEVKDISREHADKFLGKQRPKLQTAQLEAELLDKATTSIASWDWGENTLGDLDLEYSFENVRLVLDTHGWIYDQVSRASEDRGNFTSK